MLSTQENLSRLEKLAGAIDAALTPAKQGNSVQTHGFRSAELRGTDGRVESLAAAAVIPQTIDPADFVRGITNEYFPLTPGATFVYEGESADGHEMNRFTVTRNTVTIMGVKCVEVVDSAYVDGELVERTRDWFAQDADGNVWYFGEASRDYEDGQVVSTDGSWKAGVDGALPGIIMLADPEGGETYNQELAPGIAEDKATVIGDEFGATTVYGKFEEVLKTKEFTPLEPTALEFKFYAEGIGQILTINPVSGTRTDLVRMEFNGTAGNDALVGNSGRDYLRGLDGHDTLSGRSGNDMIFGGKGNDVLRGGDGDDWHRGDQGRDTFVFSGFADGKQTTDTIADYHRNEGDRLDFGSNDAARVEAELFLNGVWHLLMKGDGDVIRLTGAVDANHDGHIVDDLLFA
ncbi:MAG: hypothetical protein ACKVP5_06320 [Aestuariivirga sp.]